MGTWNMVKPADILYNMLKQISILADETKTKVQFYLFPNQQRNIAIVDGLLFENKNDKNLLANIITYLVEKNENNTKMLEL